MYYCRQKDVRLYEENSPTFYLGLLILSVLITNAGQKLIFVSTQFLSRLLTPTL